MENIDFVSIYRKYRSRAFNIGKFILGDEDEAEDVCQDVFETLFHMGRSVDFSATIRHPIIAKRPSGNMNMRTQMRFWK